MPSLEPSSLLRAGLLDGVRILLACADRSPGPLAGALAPTLATLGTSVLECPALADGEPCSQEAIAQALRRLRPSQVHPHLLVIDAAGIFEAAYAAGLERLPGAPGAAAQRALSACIAASWNAVRVVVEESFLARHSSGRVVLLAPAADAGQHALAARAALENLARTLSIEWARHTLTTVTIACAPGRAGEAAALTAYLASPAGAYFSGCVFDLQAS